MDAKVVCRYAVGIVILVGLIGVFSVRNINRKYNEYVERIEAERTRLETSLRELASENRKLREEQRRASELATEAAGIISEAGNEAATIDEYIDKIIAGIATLERLFTQLGVEGSTLEIDSVHDGGSGIH